MPLNVRQGRAKLEKIGVTDIPKQAVTDTERAEPYALQCKNLWQRYEKDSPDILKGCDLGIRKGECYGLLGSNGGGKSTLLRVICGLCKPYMGAVSLFGKKQKAYKNGSLFREMLAFLPQEPVTMFVKESQDKLTACEARIAELEKPEKPTDLPFTDLTQDWYMDSIRYVYEHELMYGTTDTTFAPDDALTRGMFVTMLYRMEGKPEATGNTSFTDVPANMYYAPAIAWASANGVVYGTSETAFSPEGKITREQMAAMMRRYASFKKLDTSARADLSTFADASAVSAWATGDMQWAVASELLYGNNHNQLQPTANATRAQAAAILQRFATKIVK